MRKEIPLDGLIPGGKRYKEYQPTRLQQLQCNDGLVSYILEQTLHLCQVNNGQWEEVTTLTLEEIKKLLGNDFQETTTLHPIEGEKGKIWVQLEKEIIIADLLTAKPQNRISIEDDWESFDYNAATQQFAFLDGNGLYLLKMDGSVTTVYQSENRAITAGQTAARDEFGNEKGTFWSKDGHHLAFFITDQSAVTEYPLVDIEQPIAKMRAIRYPMAGQASEQTNIGIYHTKSGGISLLEKQGGTEDYLCCVTFTPNNKQLLAAELTRDQQHCQLNIFDAESGKYISTILREEDERYTEPEHTPFFIPNTNKFVWQSRKNGYKLPYTFDLESGDLTLLMSQEAETLRLVGYDAPSGKIVIESNCKGWTTKTLQWVDLNGKFGDLGTCVGTHKATLIGNGYYIDEEESPTLPYKAILRNLSDFTEETVIFESNNPLDGYDTPSVEMGTLPLNGYDICYRLIKPSDFDANKKYPMVCYFYGGPHVQLIRSDWNCGTAGFEYMMAQAGYIVFTIDPRGSANRGKDFEQEIWRNIGGPQLEDYKLSVKWAISHEKAIDSNRIGVYGWSFGGFMSTSLMLKCGDLFKVGVAGGPVTNWSLYEVMYTERYMQTPEENPKGYEKHQLTRYVKDLKGKLMLIHCNTDPVVLWQNSLEILKQAVEDDKQIDYSVYVGFPHNVRGPKRVHLMKKVKQYFDENL